MISRGDEAFAVRLMCRLLKVSPSGYYDWRDRPASPREQDNARLLEQIRAIHAESDCVYGSHKVWEELVRRGEGCGENRVARLMQAACLQGIPAVRRWRGRKSGQRPGGLTNHLARDFTVTVPNTKWVTDITYIRTGEGWLYLAVVLDLATRRVIGWSMRQSLDRELVLQAVLMALWQRPGNQPVILHSDRGTQYTSAEYQAFLKEHGIVSSMSGVGSCYDNAVAESFFGLLKRERVNRRCYATRAQARADVFDYIERFYNRQRSHSYADGLSPATYAETLSKSLN
jgi:putative transposase